MTDAHRAGEKVFRKAALQCQEFMLLIFLGLDDPVMCGKDCNDFFLLASFWQCNDNLFQLCDIEMLLRESTLRLEYLSLTPGGVNPDNQEMWVNLLSSARNDDVYTIRAIKLLCNNA